MKQRLIANIVWQSAASYTSSALNLLRGLVLAKVLGPVSFGTWAAMRLSETLTQYLQLGSRSGTLQLATAADGAGDSGKAQVFRNTAAAMTVLVGFVISVCVVALASLLADPVSRKTWHTFALVVFCSHVFVYWQVYLRSKQEFKLAAKNETLFALITFAAALTTTWSFGLDAFLAAYAASYVIVLAYSALMSRTLPVPRLNWRVARQLLGTGFPIMAAQALGVLLWNTDKLMLWTFATTELLGVYAIQASFTGLILLLPTAIVSVLHPHVRYETGQEHRNPILPRLLTSNSELVAILSAPLVCLAFLSIHIPIRWWLPAYSEAIVPGRVLLIAAYFSIISALHSVVLIAHSRQRQLCLQRIIALIPVVIISLVSITMGFGLPGMASATAAGLLIAYGLTTTSSMRVVGYGGEIIARLSALNIVPLLIGLAALIASYIVFPTDGQTLLLDLRVTMLRSVVVCSCLLPWVGWRLFRSKGLRGGSPTEASMVQPQEQEPGDRYK